MTANMGNVAAATEALNRAPESIGRCFFVVNPNSPFQPALEMY